MKAVLAIVLLALFALASARWHWVESASTLASSTPAADQKSVATDSLAYDDAQVLDTTSVSGSLHDKYDEGKQVATLLNQLIAKLQAQIQSATNDANNKIAARKASISAFDDKVKAADDLINTITADIAAAQNKLNAAKAAKDTATGARTAEQASIDKENTATQQDLANQIAQLQAEIALIKSILDQLTGVVYTTFGETALLQPAQANSLAQALKDSGDKTTYALCYRASRDGYASTTFHAKCDNKGASVVVIKSTNGYVFGGTNPVGWTSANNYKQAGGFLFSVTRPGSTTFQKFLPSVYPQYAVYDNNGYLPTFGGGHDIYVPTNCNSNQGYMNLGHSYAIPGFTYGSNEIRNYLAGGYNFLCADVEVYVPKTN